MVLLPQISYLRFADLELQVAYCQAKLALLLQISQTRFGATAIINAGLFQSVKASRLFSVDPDLGAGKQIQEFHDDNLTSTGIASSKAVKTHFALLLAVMRVINAAVVSRGDQNEQTLTLGRRFLAENRLSVLTVFKRSMNIGVNVSISSDRLVDDLAESYMLLITFTGFINVSGTLRNSS
jgi:nuclear pore complex protein Nup205